MRAHAMRIEDVTEAQLGWVVTEDVRARDGKRLLRKGALLDRATLDHWVDAQPGEIHLLELEAGELHENQAGECIARAVGGEGIQIKGPLQSRFNLVAERKGLLRVDIDLLRQVNRIEGVTVFSLLDRQTVLPGKVVAGVKVTPIAIPRAHVAEVERLCQEAARPPLAVLPFAPKRVAVVATEGLNEKMRARFRATVEQKMRWYGSEVSDVRFVESEPRAVAGALRDFLADGADILMAAGGNTIDPLDPIFQSLPLIGAEMVHFGAPAHPGSMFWLARAGQVPIFNLASCSMYSRATVADLILPLVMTGQTVTSDDIVELGYGGLLEREMAFRFPNYDAEASDEGDESEE
jgi:hypothetical protein